MGYLDLESNDTLLLEGVGGYLLEEPAVVTGVGVSNLGYIGSVNGIVPGVLTATRPVVAGSDDAKEASGMSPDTGQAVNLIDAVNFHLGLRFTDLPIQQGSIISDLRISLTLSDSSKNDAEGTWYCHDVDDAATFTTTNGDLDGRAKTTATVAWTTNDLGNANDRVTTPNLSACLQEVVDRPGWQPGNSVVLLYVHNSTTDKIEVAAYENVTLQEPSLYVEYHSIPQVSGVATSALGYSAPASGVARELGVGVSNLGFVATASGTPFVSGVATSNLGYTATASGVVTVPGVTGQATSDLGYVATALGVATVHGVGASSLGFTATASGTVTTRGSGVGSLGYVAAVSGVTRTLGSGAGSLGYTATGQGVAEVFGAGVSNLGYVAQAQGFAGTPPVTGQATGLLGFTGVGVGLVQTQGQGVGNLGFAGTGAGTVRTVATAVGSLGGGGTASGEVRGFGTGQGQLSLVGQATGFTVTPAHITGVDDLTRHWLAEDLRVRFAVSDFSGVTE